MDTLELIKDITGSDVEFMLDKQRVRPEKSEVFRLWCDNGKIQALTGWEPRHTLREGLEKTVEWFSDPRNLAKYKPGIYNI
jgi:nucleoside-diphosphate-sugar epimerase